MAGPECESTDLVPGDIVNLSSSDLRVPAHLFSLSGYAIVNESMLTSVPVGKIPIKTTA